MQEHGGRRKYDKQFKEEAVKLVTEDGRTVVDVARSLGYMRICCAHGNESTRKIRLEVFLAKGIRSPRMKNCADYRERTPV